MFGMATDEARARHATLASCFSSKTEEIRYLCSQQIQKQVSGLIGNSDHGTSSNTSECILPGIFHSLRKSVNKKLSRLPIMTDDTFNFLHAFISYIRVAILLGFIN